MRQTLDSPTADFLERRNFDPGVGRPLRERRQFANTYDDLSAEARELAMAIDGYKLQHRRRFVTYDEMLQVIQSLGYVRQEALATSIRGTGAFVDRRGTMGTEGRASSERRQFGAQNGGLSPLASELAAAIDAYKLLHRRRFITYEEMLNVLKSLGYRKAG